jgi:hypothetical protein
MENFFNYVTKPLKPEDVEIWFRANDIIYEKLDLFSDFSHTLYLVMSETYFDEDQTPKETKVYLSDEDKENHFKWCWNKTINIFKEEDINFKVEGEHYTYFKTFFDDIFYNQKEPTVKESIDIFFNDLFNLDKPFTKSDLDMVSNIYKLLDKNLEK